MENKKLYFKPSATEALHSAILLKARNPTASTLTSNANLTCTTSVLDTSYNTNTSNLNLNKIPNLNVNVLNKPNEINRAISCPKLNQTLNDQLNSNHINNSSIENQMITDNGNNITHAIVNNDEFDSPIKIKENILWSIRNLKPALIGLDPLRSSNSGDEEDDTCLNNNQQQTITMTTTNDATPSTATQDNSNCNFNNRLTDHEKLINENISNELTIGSNAINSNIISNEELILLNNTNQMKLQISKIQQLQQQRNICLRTSTSPITTTVKTFHKNLSTTKLPQFNKPVANINLTSNNITSPANNHKFTNNLIGLAQINISNNRLTSLPSSNGKRVKEEALSNSSSSDEEDQQQNHQHTSSAITTTTLILNEQNLNNLKLPTTITNVSSLKLLLSSNETNKSVTNVNNFNYNSLSSIKTNINHQPHITPVVSASSINSVSPSFAISPSPSSSTSSSSQTNNNNINPGDQEIINSPSSISSNSSFKSQKSSIDQEYDLKCTNSSLSVASPNSCCSSSFAANESQIDLQDDNSSSASEPSYVRQPGFDFHAHSVINQATKTNLIQTDTDSLSKSENQNAKTLNDAKQKTLSNRVQNQKTSENSNENSNKSVKNLGFSLVSSISSNKISNKSKKKFCPMNTESSLLINNIASSNGKDAEDHNVNFQLKPISSKAKREPLPMRLRALPLSFWQQPNHPNVSPGTMYLPPLFKNEIETVEESSDSNKSASNDAGCFPAKREIRISTANTDLLFKLFDNLEQQEKKKLQMKLKQNKINRSNHMSMKQTSTQLSKALIKGEDPCIINAVSDDLFPLLRLDSRNGANLLNGNLNETVNLLAFKTCESSLMSLNSSGLSNSSPILSANSNSFSYYNNSTINVNTNGSLAPILQNYEQNYSQELSEVVAAL